MTLKRALIFALLALCGLTFLGGSAIWHILGLAKNLDISGRADIVATAPSDLGQTWDAYGGDAGGNRYVAATQITPDNVNALSIAWHYRSGALEHRPAAAVRRTAFESTPILVEDNLIFCTQFNEVIALDPASGTEKWRFDPEVPTDVRPANQYTCRGVSYWKAKAPDTNAACQSRLFMGTVDSRLIALDAKTGQPCSDFGQGGTVTITPTRDLRWPGEAQITSAPAVIGDIVVTGTAIGDNLRTHAPRGVVHAFDVRTGAPKWQFNPVPQNPNDPAAASWAENSAQTTGHANVWSTMSVDPGRNLIFLPTSSPSPDYYGGHRIGDNRYANSVVALKSDTGEVAWHFQAVHHDLWDYDLPAQPGLYQVWKDGQFHDVVAQATKMGLIFVLDRETGEPFLPIEERAVPQGGVNGEALSPTQPFPALTPPLVPNTLDPSQAFGLTLFDKMACAKQIKALRDEGLYTPPSLQGTLAFPFTGGGANWGSTAYDPARNLLVVNMSNIASFIRLAADEGDYDRLESIDDGAEFAPMEGAPYTMKRGPLLSPLGLPCSPPPWGIIAGVDLATGEIVWRSTLGTTQDLAPEVPAMTFGTPNIGGPLTTASGLIFIGATMDDYLRAFMTDTGQEIWKGRLPAGGQATPMSYMYQGRQYVVIAAGGHSGAETRQGDHVIAFALPAHQD